MSSQNDEHYELLLSQNKILREQLQTLSLTIDSQRREYETQKEGFKESVRQIYNLFKYTSYLAQTSDTNEKITYLLNGLTESGIFSRASIATLDSHFIRSDIAFAGFNEPQLLGLDYSKDMTQADWNRLLSDEYRKNNIYILPEGESIANILYGVSEDENGFHPFNGDLVIIPLRDIQKK
jgi:hypothetical protein